MKKIICISIFLAFVSVTNAQWVKKSNGLPTNLVIANFVASGTNLFVGTNNGVYLSTNNGDNWIPYSNGLPNLITELEVIGNNLFAATQGSTGVYKSTNNGANWTQVNSGLTDLNVNRLTVKGTDLYAGTYDNGIFRTTNYGVNWSNCLNTSRVYSLQAIENDIYAGTHYAGVFRSTNNGLNWIGINSGITFPVFGGFASVGNYIFAGTRDGGGVFRTTNYGNNWNTVNNGLIFTNEMKVCSKDSSLFAGNTTSGGVFISTNKGGNWVTMNDGFDTIPGIAILYVSNDYLFAGTTRGVWRRNLSELTGMQNTSAEIPLSYSLYQNYPNPFNPSTNIKFELPKSNYVTLKIYDILGREISTLVNEQLKPGTYEVDWDGSSFASGVYYYKLISGDFIETKKMILLK